MARAVLTNRWAATWQNQQSECMPSEDSDQHGHPPSLIRVFAVRMKKALVLSYPLSAQRRLWSDWADAQADLSLRWAHSHFVGFVLSRFRLRDNCFSKQISLTCFFISFLSEVCSTSGLNVCKKCFVLSLIDRSYPGKCIPRIMFHNIKTMCHAINFIVPHFRVVQMTFLRLFLYCFKTVLWSDQGWQKLSFNSDGPIIRAIIWWCCVKLLAFHHRLRNNMLSHSMKFNNNAYSYMRSRRYDSYARDYLCISQRSTIWNAWINLCMPFFTNMKTKTLKAGAISHSLYHHLSSLN